MAFSNLFFIFAFLPLSLVLHRLAPRKLKHFILLVCSLLFFAWGTPEYMLLMVCSLLFNYFSGLELGAQKEAGQATRARFTLISAVTANLLLLGFFKYYGFLVENINALLGTSLHARELPMPIGVSFFTFSILSYLFDVYRDKAPEAKNLLNFSLYVTFFPKLVSGPIAPYAAFAAQLENHPVTREKLGNGVRLFFIGLAKKVLISNTLSTTFYAIYALDPAQASVATAWLCALTYSFVLYFDFSGYSDMAIGLAAMFGFEIEKNFDYPYSSSTVAEFWRRWHISLGGWFRDYVYIPLGGSRAGDAKTIRNLCVVWLLTGLWHGASWNFIVWGVYYGLLLILEKFVLRNLVEKLPIFLKHALTLLLVVIGWVFFFSDSLGTAFGWLGSMFGLGGSLMDATARYYLSGCWIMLLVAAVGSFSLPAALGRRSYRLRGKLPRVVTVVLFAVLLALCVASMMNDTYSSFLYFQF